MNFQKQLKDIAQAAIVGGILAIPFALYFAFVMTP